MSYLCLLILISKWVSILLSTCLLFSGWAFIPTMDSLFSTFQMSLYKENILLHRSCICSLPWNAKTIISTTASVTIQFWDGRSCKSMIILAWMKAIPFGVVTFFYRTPTISVSSKIYVYPTLVEWHCIIRIIKQRSCIYFLPWNGKTIISTTTINVTACLY